jgi:hypothetical protein
LNGLVSLPDVFFEPYYEPHSIESIFCPRCLQKTFHEMCGPIPMRGLTKLIKRFTAMLMHKSSPIVWYWCSNCGVRVRKSELNELIENFLGETKVVHIDMTKPQTSVSVLPAWLKRLHRLVRSYRVSEWRTRNLVALFVGAVVAWIAWIQFTLQPFTTTASFGLVTMALMVENFVVNVRVRKLGGRELNPMWRCIEKHIQFKYAFPLLIGAISLAAFLMLGSVLHIGLWSIPLIYAPAFPICLICCVNDALALWDTPNISEELESSRTRKVKLEIIRTTQTSVLPAWLKRAQGWLLGLTEGSGNF